MSLYTKYNKSFNHLGLFVLHGAQSSVQFYLASLHYNDILLPVYRTYPTGLPWNTSTVYTNERLFYIHPMFLVASFLMITAISHLISAIYPLIFPNWPFRVFLMRGFEYSITSTIMVIAMSMMSGIVDLFAIINIGCCNVVMILCGILIDHYLETAKLKLFDLEKKRKVNISHAWMMFAVGCVSGGAPWVSIFTSIGLMGTGLVPGLVYATTISIMWFFFCFAVHAALVLYFVSHSEPLLCGKLTQRWYIDHEEPVYMILSLLAKTQLSWMVYFAFIMVAQT